MAGKGTHACAGAPRLMAPTLVDRMLVDDEPFEGDAYAFVVCNLLDATTRQRATHPTMRVRARCATLLEARAVAAEIADMFDTYIVAMRAWFTLPPVADADGAMACALDAQVRANLQREIDTLKRRDDLIAAAREGRPPPPEHDVRVADSDQSAAESARHDEANEAATPPPPPAPPHGGRIVHADRCEDVAGFVVFSSFAPPPGAVPGASAMVKIHHVADDEVTALRAAREMHRDVRTRHTETSVARMGAWLRVPPPESAPTTYDDPEHDAIYAEKAELDAKVKAVKRFHEERAMHHTGSEGVATIVEEVAEPTEEPEGE